MGRESLRWRSCLISQRHDDIADRVDGAGHPGWHDGRGRRFLDDGGAVELATGVKIGALVDGAVEPSPDIEIDGPRGLEPRRSGPWLQLGQRWLGGRHYRGNVIVHDL